MDRDAYTTPSSELLSAEQKELIVSRPWGIYLVSCWFFIGVGNFLGKIILWVVSFVFFDSTFAWIFAGIGTCSFLIAIIVGIVKLKRAYMVFGGLLFIVLALMSLISFLIFPQLDIERFWPAVFVVMPILFSSASAWYCLRPSFLDKADKFVAQKKSQSSLGGD